MAALPPHRLQPFFPPFTNTGLDYFGPLQVTMHRRLQKRYVCLFTCLITSAVHLDVTTSLDTDSFLLAFRRFVSRGGSPAVIFSDNKTNLVSGERELREGIDHLNQHKIGKTLAARNIQWEFSPPSAPHFGGVWERLVQSSKIALKAVLQIQAVSEEVLATVFTEVELLLNGRLLTHVSTDPEDLVPLTPNHFILGRAYPNVPADIFTDADMISRKRYAKAKRLL